VELRAAGWNDRRPKKIEGPSKLEEVAAQVEEDYSKTITRKISKSAVWEEENTNRLARMAAILGESPKSVEKPTTPPSGGVFAKAEKFFAKEKAQTPKSPIDPVYKGAGQAMLNFLKNREQPAAVQTPAASQEFCHESWRQELLRILAELRLSHDVTEAESRIAAGGVPAERQPQELCEVLSRLAEETAEAREVGFKLVSKLYLNGNWSPTTLDEGLSIFLEETCPDLKYDVPSLTSIVQKELGPALQPLVVEGLLKASRVDWILKAAW